MTYTTIVSTTIPARVLVAVDGAGPTESTAFGAAIAALYGTRARLGAGDAELEGTFWQDNGELDPSRPQDWRWTLALPAPDSLDSLDGVAVDRSVRLVRQPATAVVATEHHGPYADEPATLAALRGHAADQGLTVSGPHTERYLTDPRTTAPQDLRTLIWYPVSSR